MTTEIRIAGTGGQGVILASIVLAEAAGVCEGRHVVQTQSYGPEARGGASRADVIISDAPILFPKARLLDILVCLSQQAADKYFDRLKTNGTALIDSFNVRSCPRRNAVCLPLAETARTQLGREIFTNIVTLGALSKVTGVVKLDSLKQAIARRVPPATVEMNERALQAGWDLATDSPAGH